MSKNNRKAEQQNLRSSEARRSNDKFPLNIEFGHTFIIGGNKSGKTTPLFNYLQNKEK